MKNLIIAISAVILFSSCGGGERGQLVGVQGREKWYQADPYGMVFIPQGSFNMGASDQDVPYSQITQSKTVAVHAFYMDNTEITNNEYRQFVYSVRDSMAHRLLGGEHLLEEGEYGERINWEQKIKWDEEENIETLADLYLPESERYYRRKEIDARKLNYEYQWIDLKAAAQKTLRDEGADAAAGSFSDRKDGRTDRSVFIKKEIINIYPDTLCWIHDYTYSFNDPIAKAYFWHPAYDDYPVVGVKWKQANAFCVWRTQLLNSYLEESGEAYAQDFRLPTESEWEYASRGGLANNPYPWGGPYTRNSNGCFLANFKPLRGNYTDDGGFYTVKTTSYFPNDFGLYCMAGNVAEWTSNAYDNSAYNFMHDLNPDYIYNAADNDSPELKKKVTRGGSWKDIGYFIQTSTRNFEYQDTCESYLGFRCVMDFLGRDKADF